MAGILSDSQLAQLAVIAKEQPNPSYEPLGAAADEKPAAESSESSESTESTEPAEMEIKEPTADKEAEPAEPTEEPAAATPLVVDRSPGPAADGKLLFSFRYQPWQEVLDWFAEQSDLSLVLEAPPSGTFNYTDRRRYTPAEALDVLNSVLLTKGYTLVRRERMLVLVNLEDGIPPNLVADVPLEEIDERGEFELVRVLFRVRNMTPEAASEEIQKLLGPQGSVDVLSRAGMLQVTETAGRIRVIDNVIQAIERPDLSQVGAIVPFDLEFAAASELLPVLRQMLGIPTDAFSTPEGTLQVAIDTSANTRILAFGTPEMMERLREVLELVDVPPAGGGMVESLQLEVYTVNQADPEAVLQVMQTLLGEEPGVRLATDPQTGNLVALATPSVHSTIRATLSQMQDDARQIEVIPLANVDPQLALLSITKLFGITSGEEIDPRLPVVYADLSTRSLMVRASSSQIEQIRTLLGNMGESEDSIFSASAQGNVRLLPLTASEARTAIDQLDKIWPTIRSNPIRLVSPATAIRSYRPSESAPGEEAAPGEVFDWDLLLPPNPPAGGVRPQSDRGAGRRPTTGTPAKMAVYQQPAEGDSGLSEESPPESVPNSPILVAPGPNGLLIASDDLEALDAYERLIAATTSQSMVGGREYAVFYLKHAKAVAAADILSQIFGGGAGGGDSLLGGIADAALGDIGGGLMGDLLGLGGSGAAASGFSAAGVDIVTDARLNALIVYARPDDIDTVFRLLQVLDQRSGPTDVEADGVARLIPVRNTSASQVAAVVKEIYANRLDSGPGGQPSPEDLLKALRGGANGGGGQAQEEAKMTVGIDVRSNSLIVRAPDTLFAEVEALVQQLDTEQLDSTQSTQIVSLKFSNSSAVKEALGSILGENAITSTPAQTGATGGSNGGDTQNQDAAQAARQQQEFIRRIQEFRNRVGANAGGGGRGPGGGGREAGGRDGGGRAGGGRGGGGRGGR
ncbi:MAG: secretin N-terminal domain-containing protein, partial [Aeoliella sp.]